MTLHDLFEKREDEFLRYDRIEPKIELPHDLHAFNLLHKLVPRRQDMVVAAEHDEIFLSVEPDALEAVATEEQIVELIRCGVRLSNYDTLAMFV